MIKRPSSLGLPEKFQAWRVGQEAAIRRLVYGKNRFHAIVLPTGAGKSLTYVSYAMLEDTRTVILTSTRQLQTQLMTDFEELGLVDIRGRDNYVCDIDEKHTAATAICTQRQFCPRMKHGGCGYYDQLNLAREAQLVVTNYSFWLNDEARQKLGQFSTVICDEAHQLPDQISSYASVQVRESELAKLEIRIPAEKGWLDWIGHAQYRLEKLLNDTSYTYRDLAQKLATGLGRVADYQDQGWLFSREKVWRSKFDYWLKWDLLDPAPVAESMAFRGARRVILSSASVRRKTLSILGIPKEDADITEQQSAFPIKRRPIYYWPVAKVSQKSTEQDLWEWTKAIGLFVMARGDRRGMIHTVSYDRAARLYHGLVDGGVDEGRLILHRPGGGLVDTLDRLRGGPRNAVLLTPAATEGVDLPYAACEFQVIAKVPFPDTRSRIMRERVRRDRQYSFYLAAQAIVQSVGRGMRAADDQCETLIPDALFGWLMAKYRAFTPHWFQQAIRTIPKTGRPPNPPPRLAE